MFRRIVSFVVTISFVFTQTGFAQMALPRDISGIISRAPAADSFRPAHLRSLTYAPGASDLQLLLDKGDAGMTVQEETAKKLFEYFQVGITLPNSSFFVNLRPDSRDSMIAPELARTDMGKVLLQADLQLKKDLCLLTSPDCKEGKEYWSRLYAKAESMYGTDQVSIPTVTRPWIVPGEIIVREGGNSAYIYKATLKVQLEQDYLKNDAQYTFSDSRQKALNEYSTEILKDLVLPVLVKKVNSSAAYAPLRQVYYSLIFAQWFKQRFSGKAGIYSSRIDSSDLTGLVSRQAWDPGQYFQAYKTSFSQGEYNKEIQSEGPAGMRVRKYTSGGVDLEACFAFFAKAAGLVDIAAQGVIPEELVDPDQMVKVDVNFAGAVSFVPIAAAAGAGQYGDGGEVPVASIAELKANALKQEYTDVRFEAALGKLKEYLTGLKLQFPDLEKFIGIDQALDVMRQERKSALAGGTDITALKSGNMKTELLDIVNDKDEVDGKAPRWIAHIFGLRHRTTNAIVVTPDGKILLQRRVHNKAEPKRLSIFGGHVSSGEAYDSLKREMQEELHLAGPATGDLVPVGEPGQFAWNGGKKGSVDNNEEFRSLFVYFIKPGELAEVNARQKELEKHMTSEQEYREYLEAQQEAKSGYGEVWSYIVKDLAVIKANKRQGGIPLKDKWETRETIAEYTADLLQPLLTGTSPLRKGTPEIDPLSGIEKVIRAQIPPLPASKQLGTAEIGLQETKEEVIAKLREKYGPIQILKVDPGKVTFLYEDGGALSKQPKEQSITFYSETSDTVTARLKKIYGEALTIIRVTEPHYADVLVADGPGMLTTEQRYYPGWVTFTVKEDGGDFPAIVKEVLALTPEERLFKSRQEPELLLRAIKYLEAVNPRDTRLVPLYETALQVKYLQMPGVIGEDLPAIDPLKALDIANARANALAITRAAARVDADSVKERLRICARLRALAPHDTEMEGFVDYHSHTFRSDGEYSPSFNLYQAWKHGMKLIAVTDHNTDGHFDELVQAAAIFDNVEVVPGIEFDVSTGELTRMAVENKKTHETKIEGQSLEFVHMPVYFPGIKGKDNSLFIKEWEAFKAKQVYADLKERFLMSNTKLELMRQRFNQSKAASAYTLSISWQDWARFSSDFPNWAQLEGVLRKKYGNARINEVVAGAEAKDLFVNKNEITGLATEDKKVRSENINFWTKQVPPSKFGIDLGGLLDSLDGTTLRLSLAHPKEDRNVWPAYKDAYKTASAPKQAEMLFEVVQKVVEKYPKFGELLWAIEVYSSKHSPEQMAAFDAMTARIEKELLKGRSLQRLIASDTHHNHYEGEGGMAIGSGEKNNLVRLQETPGKVWNPDKSLYIRNVETINPAGRGTRSGFIDEESSVRDAALYMADGKKIASGPEILGGLTDYASRIDMGFVGKDILVTEAEGWREDMILFVHKIKDGKLELMYKVMGYDCSGMTAIADDGRTMVAMEITGTYDKGETGDHYYAVFVDGKAVKAFPPAYKGKIIPLNDGKWTEKKARDDGGLLDRFRKPDQPLTDKVLKGGAIPMSQVTLSEKDKQKGIEIASHLDVDQPKAVPAQVLVSVAIKAIDATPVYAGKAFGLAQFPGRNNFAFAEKGKTPIVTCYWDEDGAVHFQMAKNSEYVLWVTTIMVGGLDFIAKTHTDMGDKIDIEFAKSDGGEMKTKQVPVYYNPDMPRVIAEIKERYPGAEIIATAESRIEGPAGWEQEVPGYVMFSYPVSSVSGKRPVETAEGMASVIAQIKEDYPGAVIVETVEPGLQGLAGWEQYVIGYVRFTTDAGETTDGGEKIVKQAQQPTDKKMPGGIDMRGLPIQTQPLMYHPEAATVAGEVVRMSLAQLQSQWKMLEKRVRMGLAPYGEINQYVSACVNSDEKRQVELVHKCIADMLRKEELTGQDASPEVRDILYKLN